MKTTKNQKPTKLRILHRSDIYSLDQVCEEMGFGEQPQWSFTERGFRLPNRVDTLVWEDFYTFFQLEVDHNVLWRFWNAHSLY